MKTNVNNSENKYTRKAIEALKSEIKASAYDEIELTKYGIQIYASYLDSEEYHEYYVVDIARRDIRTGRYYFITREGVRIAWSRLDINTLIVAAVDFLDAIESEEKRAAETLARLECYGSQQVESRFFFLWVRPLLDTMGTPYHIEATGSNDLGETIDLVRIEDTDRVPTWDTIERATDEQLATMKADRIRKAEALHAAAYFIAAVKVSELTGQLSEEQDRRRKATEADTCESAARAAFYQLSESKRKAIRYAAHLIATGGTVEDRGAYLEVNKTEWLAAVTIDAADADHLRHLLTRKAKAAEVTARDCEARELTDAAKVAATRASRCKTIAERLAKVARVVLLAVTLTTGTPADTEAVESPDNFAELLTTDPARELADLRAAGLTVTRYEIKDAPATLREVATC